MESKSNMRDLPADQSLGSQPVVEKGKLYAATQGQQDQLAQFAATIGAPIPEEHRPENKGHQVPEGTPVVADKPKRKPRVKKAVDAAIQVEGVGFDTTPAETTDAPARKPRARRKVAAEAQAVETDLSSAPAEEVVESPADTTTELKDVELQGVPIKGEPEVQNFAGFEIPEGEYYAMLMLQPERDADGKVGEVPQIRIGVTREDWKSWVKQAVTHGLTQGFVHAEDGVTELNGFSAMVVPQAGAPRRMAFLFKQVAAIIPFREVDELMLKREKANEEAARLAKKNKAEKKAARKKQSAARRKNRR